MRSAPALVLVICGSLCALRASAQIVIQAGATIDLGTTTLNLGCSDLTILGTLHLSNGALLGVRSLLIQAGGQLTGDAGTLAWSGDWTNAGQFDAGTSSASSVDGCGRTSSTFNTGDAFHSLSLQTTQGREIHFTGGQATTIGANFTATGVLAQPLRIRSTTPGIAAVLSLAPQATQSIFAVDVADNHAAPRPIAPGPPALYASIKGNNSNGWFEGAAALDTIPALSTTGLALIAAALSLAALLRLSVRGA